MVKVATGTGVKTMLQIAPPSGTNLELISWGYELDAVPGSGSSIIELLETDTAATVTAHNANAIYNSDPNGQPSLLTVGAAATGFTASAEGSAFTSARVFGAFLISSTAGASQLNDSYQFVPDERDGVLGGRFLRVRVNFAATVNMLCWAKFRQIG